MTEKEEVKERKAGGGGAERPLHGNSFIRKTLTDNFLSTSRSPDSTHPLSSLFSFLPTPPIPPPVLPTYPLPPSTLSLLTFLFFFLYNVTIPLLQSLYSAGLRRGGAETERKRDDMRRAPCDFFCSAFHLYLRARCARGPMCPRWVKKSN